MMTPGEPLTKEDTDDLVHMALDFCRRLEEETHGPADGMMVIALMLARLSIEPGVIDGGGMSVMFKKLRIITEGVLPHVEVLVKSAHERSH